MVHKRHNVLGCTLLAVAVLIKHAQAVLVTDGYITQSVRDPWDYDDEITQDSWTDSAFSLHYGQKRDDAAAYDGTALMFDVAQANQADPISTTLRPLCGRYNQQYWRFSYMSKSAGCSSNGGLASYPGDYKEPLQHPAGWPWSPVSSYPRGDNLPWTSAYYDRDKCYQSCADDDTCVAFNFYFRMKANFMWDDVNKINNGFSDPALYNDDSDRWIYKEPIYLSPYVSVREEDNGNMYPSWSVCELYAQLPNPTIKQQPVYPVAASQWWIKNTSPGYDVWSQKKNIVW